MKLPPELEIDILQIAIKLGVLPDQVEQMDAHWYNRMLIYMRAEAEASKRDD